MLLRLLGAFVLGLLLAVWLGSGREPVSATRLLDAMDAGVVTVILPDDLTPEHRAGLVLAGGDGEDVPLGETGGFAPGEELTLVIDMATVSFRDLAQQHRIYLIGDEIHAVTRWQLEDEQAYAEAPQLASGPQRPGDVLAYLPGKDGERQTPPGQPPEGDDYDLVLRVWLP